jgi:D-alanyl-D-alanine carboxypeptidase
VITLGPSWLVADGLSLVMTALERSGSSLDVDRVESLANTAMFVPLGASLGLAVRPRAWPLVALAGAALSAAVELAQTRLPGRVPDVQDLVANAGGGLIGLGIAVVLVGAAHLVAVLRRSHRSGARPMQVVGVVVLVAALALAAFLAFRGTAGAHAAAPAAPSDPRSLTRADGYLPDGGVSPFADDEPAIARLRPGLRHAVQQAARDAEAEGVDVVVTTGWRSAAYQQRLLDDAIAQYGSREAALRWVSTPRTSEHVRGAAVDIGATDADDWFLRNGSRYGLCRTYANEMWHFELATTPGGTCPAEIRDASAR